MPAEPDRSPHSASRRPAPIGDDVRIAAIGIGSNSIRQIVADVSPDGEIRVIDEMKAAPRLGEGVGESGRLGDAAVRNALAALLRMATLTRQMGAVRTEAVATSAVRDAENGAEFIAAVRDTTGLSVRVLNGDEEALLSYRSALAHFDLAIGRAVVMDIGGGSMDSCRFRSAQFDSPSNSSARVGGAKSSICYAPLFGRNSEPLFRAATGTALSL